MHDYPGNPASYPANVGLIDDSDAPNASNFNVSPQNLADRTAFINANALYKTGGTITGAIVLVSGASIDLTGTATLIVRATASVAVFGLLEIESAGTLQFDAGSTLEGTVSAGVLHSAGNQVSLEGNGSLIAHAFHSILADVPYAIAPTVAGAIQSAVAGGISSGIAGGISGDSAGGIAPTVAGGISDGGVLKGIRSTVPGGIEFAGGATDYGALTPPRAKSYSFFPTPVTSAALDGTNWAHAIGLSQLTGLATTTPIDLRIENPHDGATLVSVVVTFVVRSAHASPPGALPTIAVFAQAVAPGSLYALPVPLSTVSPQTDATSPAAFPPPASGAAWYDGQLVQTMTFTCNQNNVIDNANNVYFIRITDESGVGSAAGNSYPTVTCVYTNITDLRFAS